MDYGLFFSEESTVGLSTIRIPVNPEKYGYDHPGDVNTYNVLGLGEVVQPRTPKLFELSWDGVFPGSPDYPGVATRGKFEEPRFYIDAFLRFQRSGLPVQFTAVRAMEDGTLFSATSNADIKTQVIVEDFSYEERGGETGDFYYTIKLREYRNYLPQGGAVVDIADDLVPKAAVVIEPQRAIPPSQIYVGCKVQINGRFYSDSYGGGPYGTASNRSGVVSKIITSDSKRPMPVHVKSNSGGALGWVKADQLQVVP